MKRLERVVGAVLAVMLAVCSLQTLAETPLAGRDFNHNATGFPLTGIHALAACETCHVAGVFKGTPKNCDGCHALGKRVVATPKSTGHIVTDAPCETCHFNASTFLGARFNHGTAMPGQCSTCHNGRQSIGKPASHGSGNKATKSCDSCHRSYTWFFSGWNHVGAVPGQCGTACHYTGGDGTAEPASHNASDATKYTTVSKHTRFPACDACHNFGGWPQAAFNHIGAGIICADCHFSPTAHSTPAQYNKVSKSNYACQTCHTGTRTWIPATFLHNVPGTCDSCHSMKVGHIAINGATCDTCHRSKSAWLPASNHSGNETGICRTCHASTPQPSSHLATEFTSLSCDVCHKSQTTWTGASGHIDLIPPHVPTCRSCHNNREHDGKDGATASMDCSRSGCHQPGGSKGRLFSKWD